MCCTILEEHGHSLGKWPTVTYIAFCTAKRMQALTEGEANYTGVLVPSGGWNFHKRLRGPEVQPGVTTQGDRITKEAFCIDPLNLKVTNDFKKKAKPPHLSKS